MPLSNKNRNLIYHAKSYILPGLLEVCNIFTYIAFSRYYAVIVIIGNSTTSLENIGPYNMNQANEAFNNGGPYAYIAGIIMSSDISNYPHPYIVGDSSPSSIGSMTFTNVPLRSNTVYSVMIRAHTADDLVSTL